VERLKSSCSCWVCLYAVVVEDGVGVAGMGVAVAAEEEEEVAVDVH